MLGHRQRSKFKKANGEKNIQDLVSSGSRCTSEAKRMEKGVAGKEKFFSTHPGAVVLQVPWLHTLTPTYYSLSAPEPTLTECLEIKLSLSQAFLLTPKSFYKEKVSHGSIINCYFRIWHFSKSHLVKPKGDQTRNL